MKARRLITATVAALVTVSLLVPARAQAEEGNMFESAGKKQTAKDFWSFTLYDNQTRGMLQTDQQFPGVSSVDKELQQNADGSYDVYFSPKAPKGKENNWIQTVPGKGWNMLFRLYGPLDPWFDKTWRPGDPELVK